MVIGGLMFFSVIASGFMGFGRMTGMPSSKPAVFGAVLIGIGGFIRDIGARGMAGSGIILNAPKARKDLEPHSRMVGGMINDALEEVDGLKKTSPEPTVMIRYQACGKLNEEDSKFCQECGKPI